MVVDNVTRLKKLALITLPAMIVVAIILMAAVEVWVRATRNPLVGTPGFFLSDAARGQRLAPNYSGWFAGVPVRINSLGIRDEHEPVLEKGPRTFRILVLGDSVTFGHGSVAEHAYPALLEQELRQWRPDVDWQVWNAAVPGYNTSQELAQLLEIGPRVRPDLVVVGFYENDLIDNYVVSPPSRAAVWAADIISFGKRYIYSLELYKKVYLTLRWRLSASDAYHKRVEHLATEDELLANLGEVANLKEQQITPFERLTDAQVQQNQCPSGQKTNPAELRALQEAPGFRAWLEAVRRLQGLNANGTYRIVFFLNVIPVICPDGDFFYDGGVGQENEFYLKTMGEGTPIVSVYDTFLHRRPSQMPMALAHAIGNANFVKAETLFSYLRDRVLPGLNHPALAAPGAGS